MLVFWFCCDPTMEPRVTAGEPGVTRVQQVTGLMERPVITLRRFIAMEPGQKINYTSGKALGDYLWLLSRFFFPVEMGSSLTNRKLLGPSKQKELLTDPIKYKQRGLLIKPLTLKLISWCS